MVMWDTAHSCLAIYACSVPQTESHLRHAAFLGVLAAQFDCTNLHVSQRMKPIGLY